MKKERNIFKRYFLSRAASKDGPFMSGLFWGMLLAGIFFVVVLSRRFPQDTPIVPWMLVILGAGLALGTINHTVCRRFVRYSPKPVLYFLANEDGEIVRDADGEVTASDRLWVPRGMDVVEVRLADTAHPHEIDPTPNSFRDIPVVLRVIFFKAKSGFDPQEVYRGIVGAGYRSLNRLVREEFLRAVRLAGLEDLFGQIYRRPLAEVKGELYKLQTHFCVAARFSNIDFVDVELAPKVVVKLY